MKRILGAVALTATTVALTGCTDTFKATTYHEDSNYEVSSSSLSKLDVRADSDNIEIVGTDAAKVSVHERLSYSKKNKPKPEHRTEGGTLVLRYQCPDKFTIGFSRCSIRYQIQVPRALALKVKADSGNLSLRGLSGQIDANIDSGGVKGTGLDGANVTARVDSGGIELAGTGSANVKADSGSIDLRDLKGRQVVALADSGNVRLRFATAPDSVVARADSGNVRIWLPAAHNEKYALTTHADSGSVDRNTIVDDPQSPHRIKATADSGNVTLIPAG